MSDARFTPLAESDPRRQGRRVALACLLSALVVSTTLTVAPPRPAAADEISQLKARATAVSQQLVQDQLQVEAYQQQYSVVSLKVDADTRAIAQTDQQLAGDQRQIEAESHAVRSDALSSYMDAGTQGPNTAMFAGDQQSAELASAYGSLAAGNIETDLDRLHGEERALQANQAALEQGEARDRSDQAQQAAALGQADRLAVQMEAVRGQVTGQLAVAVANQAAAQAAAAAAAVAAAQRARIAHTGSSTTAGSGAVAPAGSGVDPALNPFLQCVRQAESGGDYGAVSPNGMYMGAFQFSQSTWNSAAQAAGRPDLVGVPPNRASRADQDAIAVALYALDGGRPWLGDRC